MFENALDDARWHEQLLRAMTWTVPEVRERVISDATYHALSELYAGSDTSSATTSHSTMTWERLELVHSKYLTCRTQARTELAAYLAYLQRLAKDARESQPR